MTESRHNFRKMLRTALLAVVLLSLVILPVFAWYVATKRLSRTEDLEIGMPPIIYIKDDNLQEITTFNLDGLRIGENYHTVFCVSPTVQEYVDSFFLGVIYTENMGMDIHLYPVYSVTDTPPADGVLNVARELLEEDGITQTTCYFNYRKEKLPDSGDIADQYDFTETYGNWENDVKPGPGNQNNGIYKAYKNLVFTGKGEGSSPSEGEGALSLAEKLGDTSKYRFFVLDVTWGDEAEMENVKETDIVYIVSKGIRS